MGRVEIGEVVVDKLGRPVPAASVRVDNRGGGLATVYSSPTGTATLGNPLATDALGRIEGWLEEGSYDLLVTGNDTSYTQRLEAVAGAEAFTDATLANSWVNADTATYAAAGYRRANKQVTLRGRVKDGVLGAAILTLPAGYRPAARVSVAVPTFGGAGTLDVLATGEVILMSGSTGWVSLDGVVIGL